MVRLRIQENEAFEHVIRYEDGIKSDFVLASCSVPVNYDYTRLNVETRTLAWKGKTTTQIVEDNNRPTLLRMAIPVALFLGWWPIS